MALVTALATERGTVLAMGSMATKTIHSRLIVPAETLYQFSEKQSGV
jgi:hypothetical protein